MINIYLDDVRQCPKGFCLAKNHDECIKLLDANKVATMSFDHDLGEDKSGYDVAKYIVEKGMDNPEFYPQVIYIHTSNPVGRSNIFQLLNRYKPEHVKIYKYPYGG